MVISAQSTVSGIIATTYRLKKNAMRFGLDKSTNSPFTNAPATAFGGSTGVAGVDP